MKIVFAASEAAPFIKTGGLGDVAGALPDALSHQKGAEVLVFLPYYKSVKNNPDIKTEFLKSFAVSLSWRVQHVGVFRLKSKKKKHQVYFIDNEYYFGKDGAYGYADDGERFAYFSKAILESLVQLGITPDIIHANDWQTALIPVLLHAFYEEPLGGAKTVFTIHNMEYQGKCDPYFIPDVLGLPESYTNTMIFGDNTNFMKGAILMSDAVTTVSHTYADEIRYPYFAHGLASIISAHAFKLRGIVNGIDTKRYDPATDPELSVPYDIATYKDGKHAAKEALQRELGLPVRGDVPVIGIVSRLVEHKGMGLLCGLLDELMRWDLQIAIVGTGDYAFEHDLSHVAYSHPDKLSVTLRFDQKLASRIYAASDFYQMPSKSEPCGLSQLIAMRYGSVPIVHAIGGLRDTVEPWNPETGDGTGFTFQSFCALDMIDAIRRAFTLYGTDKEAFSRLIENGMRRDSSWDVPAGEYRQLYNELRPDKA